MARADRRSVAKERYWRGVVAGWRKSGLSVRAYCQAEEVSEASFYLWRRELDLRDREAKQSQRTAETASKSALFLPVQVRGESESNGFIEIVLCNRRVVRVGVGFDAEQLRRVLAVAEEG